MTLLRQLVIVIVMLFTLLFAGSMIINVNNTRAYLNNQLRTISQDMATSLGMSLSPHIAKGEMTIAESMINAVSDSGYYREVVLSDVNGKALIERSQQVTTEGVPAWFVRLIPLETPLGEAQIMAGWVQAGQVRIAANPGYAYATLWGNSVDAFWWFLGSSAVALVFGVIALRFILKPLRAVEEQAKAICNREYPIQDRLPWTLELRSVVAAMNLMSAKVRDMFKEQSDAMERLRADTYMDAVTGLANRQYFDMQLRQLTKARASSATNALLFIELAEFKSLNERLGYQAGDKLLKGCAELVTSVCKEMPNLDYFAARPSGATFAVVIQDTIEADALALAERIGAALGTLHAKGLSDVERIGHIGIAIHRGQTAGQLLSEADMALRTAQVKGPNAVHMNDSQSSGEFASYSASRWMTVLRDVLAECRIVLHRQPCVSCADEGKVLQYETLLRIYGDDGKLIPANVIIPMAKHLHLTQEFDKHIVTDTLARLSRPENAGVVVAVNLFPLSIQDGGFVAWLVDMLRSHAAVAPRIAFEVMEHGVVDHLDALRGWVERMAECGAKTGLDQVGKGFKSFNYLSTLKLDYIKIDGGFARGIQENRDNQFFVDSLVKYAHGLDIEVVAESVETREEWDMLKTLRVDGVKGYGVARPSNWE
jgi:diguanylate cyclase (GGDEF)-like protein